ncbi:polysaccharide deacetylase family protein [Dictyobacter aurantiacus]|uniref:NodB homology domain-containing protein n=1 Tax=Dictyobacter aurantiacus TaxID=1936993 RepID=A0A401ZA12_9CHLR|nr:polysaccharide deacetylase family protein [Dictyobacter aurantiacus]GCE03714.1 hypothetical protein KDAU_10430 [Dictyobacter aurantiacus]
MGRRILIMLAGFFYYSGLVAMACRFHQRAGRRAVILTYHTSKGGNFLQHLLYLRRHYRIMPLEAALEELYTGKKDPRYQNDRRTPLVISLDDGYTDNYTYAMSMARDYCIPLTIFLVPDYIESHQRFWWFEGQSIARRARVSEATLDHKHFDVQQERPALAQFIDDHVRFATSVAERETFLAQARTVLDVSPKPDKQDRDEDRLPVTWEQAREMDESGWITLGAHTMHHPILSYITDPAEVRYEVTECRRVLEEKLGHPVRSFAYPVGQVQHISDTIVQAVKDAGYDWAVTTTYGINTPVSDPYRLCRIEVDIDQHWLVIAAEAAGLWGFISRLRWMPFIRNNFTNARRVKGR